MTDKFNPQEYTVPMRPMGDDPGAIKDYREPAWLRLRIVSDGTSAGTIVMDAETGRPLFGVVRVSWEAGWSVIDQQPRVRLELEQVALDITGEGAITRLPDYPHRLAKPEPPL